MEEKKYNILVVHNYYQQAGGEDSVFRNEKELLEEHGHKVYIYTRNNNEIKKMFFLKKILLPFITIFNFKTYFDIKKMIKKDNIDIVHVHNTVNLISPAVFYAAIKMKTPVVQTIHNFRMVCPNGLFYRDNKICEDCVSKGLKCSIKHNCYRNSKLQTIIIVLMMKFHRLTGIYKRINYICLTDFNKEKLLKQGQIKEEQVFVKPNFAKEYSGTFNSYSKRNNQFIYVGRLDETKGTKELFELWKNVDSKYSLIVYGDGPLSKWCEKYVRDNNINNIKLKGFASHDVIQEELSKSKALILLSKWYEGLPMTFVESFSTGTPVIASNIGNCGMLIEDGINGYKINSKTNISDVIEKLENNKDIYNSTLNCFEKYRYQKNYKMLSDIYNKLI